MPIIVHCTFAKDIGQWIAFIRVRVYHGDGRGYQSSGSHSRVSRGGIREVERCKAEADTPCSTLKWENFVATVMQTASSKERTLHALVMSCVKQQLAVECQNKCVHIYDTVLHPTCFAAGCKQVPLVVAGGQIHTEGADRCQGIRIVKTAHTVVVRLRALCSRCGSVLMRTWKCQDGSTTNQHM
jgi:hypothetical protein